jgi:hypothetical protein
VNGSKRSILMKKLNEDWLSVIVALVLVLLALVGVISPGWMKF